MTQQLINSFAAKNNPASRWADLKPGMTVRVHQKLRQGEKGKATVFEGIIIARKHGDEAGASITVRRAVGGYGVEKVYPLRLPSIEKIDVVKTGKIGRAKLYYLRGKSAREIRKKTRAEQVQLNALVKEPAEELPAEQ
ncbi:MAG TPA: 50S ribosomal protein L19 [Candidatus Paceibacterota bacterium]|nr:50S ribosomal protein L19 [Candidatus Paceibacterota bacterium]